MKRFKQILEEQMFSIGGGGLESLKSKYLIQPNTSYWMGASSDPNLVYVTKITKDRVSYLADTSNSDKESGIQRKSFEDLVSRGTDTWLKGPYPKYYPEEVKKFKKLVQGKSVPKEKRDDLKTYRVEVKNLTDRDIWRDLENNTGGSTLGSNNAETEYSVTVDGKDLKSFEKKISKIGKVLSKKWGR